jgi:hypothetical protein
MGFLYVQRFNIWLTVLACDTFQQVRLTTFVIHSIIIKVQSNLKNLRVTNPECQQKFSMYVF